MAWTDGGGETVAVAVHPPGAGIAGFDWIASMATAAVEGPLATFPGPGRVLARRDRRRVITRMKQRS